jgi:hypothetical protein
MTLCRFLKKADQNAAEVTTAYSQRRPWPLPKQRLSFLHPGTKFSIEIRLPQGFAAPDIEKERGERVVEGLVQGVL